MSTTKIIVVTDYIPLTKPLNEEQAEELVQNMDYEFNHPRISDTEIVSDDLTNRF